MKNFDTDKIKKISIEDWMNKNGYKQGKGRSGKWRSFYSPFGSETNASFKVNTANNSFKDYHSQLSGDIISLVMEINKCSFQEACSVLSEDKHIEIEVFKPIKQKEGVEIHSVKDIVSSELLDYACGVRKISREVLMKYCSQVDFSFPYSEKDSTRVYTALGFKSDGGGYELRNSWMKLCAGGKSHTTIKGSDKSAVIMVEGFFDALSYFTYYGITEPRHTMYCLNGAGQFKALNNFIGDKEVLYYGDSDKQGDIIASEIKNITDMRHVYSYYNDFSSFLNDN